MIHSFDDTEGLRIAVEIERKGERFYRSLIRMTKNSDARTLLENLCHQEERHMERFAELRRQISQRHGDDDIATFDEETSMYLSAIAAEIVFPGGVMASLLSNRTDTLADVLMTAVYSEKDSIMFYQELSQNTNRSDSRAVFESIIHEEKEHLVSLQDLLESTPNILL